MTNQIPDTTPIRILFVCLGNICRSPSAEGVFRALAERAGLGDRLEIESAGTSAYNLNQPPDPRAQAAARKRGIDLSGLRARQAVKEDFARFDYILAMDANNHRKLSRLCPPGQEHRLGLFLDFAPDAGRRDIPDPYEGDANGFEAVLDLIERAADGLLVHIRARHFR
jgi:protein-tyrosine phosphatase